MVPSSHFWMRINQSKGALKRWAAEPKENVV